MQKLFLHIKDISKKEGGKISDEALKIIARASEGSIVKTKGKTRAKPDVPPIPGRIPTIKPSKVPANRNAK